jgi:spore germination protein GerM
MGTNYTILNSNVWGNLTANNLKQDADKAIAVLAHQPEVNPNNITIIIPVTKLLSSEAKNETALATSSGLLSFPME